MADLVGPGRAATYGDLARVAGVGPRQVGTVLAAYGHEVAWWRIVNASGRLPEALVPRAEPHWDAEGLPHRDGRLLLRACRVDAAWFADAWRRLEA